MLDIIAKYWLEFALAIVSSGLTYFVRHYYKLYKKEKENKYKGLIDEIKEMVKQNTKETERLLAEQEIRSKKDDDEIYKHIDELKAEFNTLKDGLLSLHRANFLDECRPLLEEGRTINLWEYEHILKEYQTYKNLGGNDRGDAMFRLVESKYKNSLMD